MKGNKISSALFLFAIISMAISLSACSEGSDTPIDQTTLPSSDDPLPSDENIVWTIIDACDDDSSTLVRFYEAKDSESTGMGWPGRDESFVVNGSRRFTLNCDAGTSACYGARPSAYTGFSWGAGLNGSSCEKCCKPCGSGELESTTLTC